MNKTLLGITFSIALSATCFTAHGAESALWQQFKTAKLNGTEPTLPDFSFAGYDYSESPLPDTSDWPVFNVTDYGAVANDGGYDDAAIQATINAAESAGGGIVFFPPGRFMVSFDNDITKTIRISGSNILLKGSGSGAGGTEIFMNEMKVNNGRYMFEVKPLNTSQTTLTTVTADAPRESFEIQVADASALSPGQRIILRADSVPYANAYYAPLALSSNWTRLTSTSGFNIRELHTVESVHGNTVRFREPLHLPMITGEGITIQVRSYNVITNVGVEGILFKGNWNSYPESFVHHKNAIHDYAWNALRFDNVANGWLRNCDFKDWNQCVYFDGCAAFTVDNISFTGKQGHMAVHTRRSYGILIKDCVDTAGHWHGPGVGYWGCGTVYLRHQMSGNQRIDSHSGSPYATLMDGVTGGHFDGNGGPIDSYPHHGRHFVAWNFNVSGGPNSYNFWPSSRNGHTFARPIFAGVHGKTISMSGHQDNESPGTPVEPASLFEAQLEFRLGPNVETGAASGISESGATLNGTLLSPGEAPATVRIYWGASDGSTDVNAWNHVEDLGTPPTGPLSVSVTGLVAGQTYHYRVWASNSYFDTWASESATFTIPGPPSVTATGASSAQAGQATLNGVLSGGNPADVTVVWSETDHGASSLADWPAGQRVAIPNHPDGPISTMADNLANETTYFYRIHAINHLGEAWSDASTFEVLVNPLISLLQNDATGSSSFFSGTNWSDGQPPSADKDYATAFQLRAPVTTTSNQNFTFAGDSLSINPGATLAWQGSSGHLTGSITANNLILNGGSIASFRSSTTHTMIGNISVTAQSNLNLGSSASEAALAATRHMTVNSVITGSSRLVMNAQNGQANVLRVDGNNSGFSGGFFLTGTNPAYTASLLTVGHANALGTGTITINQGILNLNGINTTIGGLTGANAAGNSLQNNSDTAATLTIESTEDSSYAGSIQNGSGTGNLGLTKLGPGSLALTGTSTHTGATRISGGALEVIGSFGNTHVTVEEGATLAGNGNLGGSLTVESGGTHQMEVAATPASQVSRSIAGTLTLAPYNSLTLTVTTPPAPGTYLLATAADGISGSIGSVNLPGGMFGTVDVIGNNVELTVTELINFDNWIAEFDLGELTGLDDDPDGDGIPNGVEAWFGTNPGEHDIGLMISATNGIVTTFTHPKNPTPPADLTGSYEWAPDLVTWYPGGSGPAEGPIITFLAETEGELTTVTATANQAVPRTFLRVRVEHGSTPPIESLFYTDDDDEKDDDGCTCHP